MPAVRPLTLRVLGEIELVRGGERVSLPASKKTRALLAYLALTAKPHRRERLCTIFWDVPDDPRAALRWSLSKLRGLVDEPGCTRIAAQRDSVGFDASAAEIDLLEVRRRLASGEEQLAPATLAETAALFRGEFLEGLELPNCPDFEAWRAAEREEARALRCRVLRTLVAKLAAQPAEALPHARTLAAVDPDSVDAHLGLLRVLNAAGRVREAESQLAASSRILGDISAASARALADGWRSLRAAAAAAETQTQTRTGIGVGVGVEIGAGAEPAAAAEPPASPEAPPEPAPSAETSPPPGTARPSIAVLPFASMGGGEQKDDYFSRGISDEIAAALARFADMTVIAPSTTARLSGMGAAAGASAIAGRLNADYVLDGSVMRADAKMRITAQLLEGPSGAHLWSERFDREIYDIFAVQDEITRTVAAALSVRLRDDGARRALKKRTRDLTAHDLLLRARRYTWMLTPEEHAHARDCLEEALRRDPDYADAHAALVYIYAAEYSHGHNPRPGSLDRAMTAGRRAIALDPHNPRAHAALALTHFFRREDALFDAEAERALALNPNDPEMAGLLGAYFVYLGRIPRGIALLGESMRLNPLHPTWYHYAFIIKHVLDGDFAGALAQLGRVDITDFHWTLVLKTALLALGGDAAAAGGAYREFRTRYPDFDVADYLGRWIRSELYVGRILEGLARAERAALPGALTTF